MKNKSSNFNIWEGIYDSPADTPQVGSGFSGNIWAEKSLANIRELISASKKSKTIPDSAMYRESLLPIVASIAFQKTKKINILDFGGNLGQEYVRLIDVTNNSLKKIQYTVIEKEEICKLGRKVFRRDPRIDFRSDLTGIKEKVDIIHVGSTLQYVQDWKKLFKEFASLKPEYIVFTDLQAGDIPTYATTQNYYDSKMPVWFFDVKEIMAQLDKSGFKVIFRSTFRGSFLGKEQDRPQENLPPKYRLKNSCNLVFVKK